MKKLNWKELRDKWLGYMVEFRKLGDDRMANLCLEQAVKVNQLRTEVEVEVEIVKV